MTSEKELDFLLNWTTSNEIARPITRQALERTAFLGSLYDATTDEFCERNIINDDIPPVAIRHLDENHGHSSYEFDSTVSRKLRKLNVDASLSLSLLGGLVKSVGATNNYIYTRDKTTQAIEATFIHRSITRTEALNISHKELKARVESSALRHRNATHVVTSIRWGADVFAQFEAESTTAEAKHVAKVALKLELNKLLSKFISVNPNNIAEPVKDAANTPAQIESGSSAPQISFESTGTKTTFNYKITVFGDLIPTSCPKSIDELIAMLPTITAGLQKTNSGKGRPLEYIMLPLSELPDILGVEMIVDRTFRAVEENTAREIHVLFDESDQLRTIVHTLHKSIQRAEEFFQEEEIHQIASYENTIRRLQRDIRSRIGKMLVRVRSGQAESTELDQLLVELEGQVFAEKKRTKQLERGDLSQRIEYALELKEKNVIAVREPDTLTILQYRHPKHQLIVLYTNQQLRLESKEKWTIAYFDYLQRMETNERLLFCYFDYDLNPKFQPQQKKLEVRDYVSLHSPTMSDTSAPPTKAEALMKTAGVIAAEFASKWFRDAKARIDELFAKSGSPILVPFTPSLAVRNQVFERLRRNQINILLIGRTRIGKTTLKEVLADPTTIPSDEKTEFPQFEQFSITGTDIILNFIDTPGLFQRTQSSGTLPDNMTLIQLIESYVRSKVNQLHFVCFCISIESPVVAEDLETLRAFFNVLGPDIRKNTCVVITKCESKSERERDEFREQAQRNLDLKVLCSQMKQGMFFVGAIDPEDWIKTSNVIYKQFQTACDDWQKLLDLFVNAGINPIDLSANILAKKLRDDLHSIES